MAVIKTEPKKRIMAKPAQNKLTAGLDTIVAIQAALKMCPEEEIDAFLLALTPDQINLMTTFCAEADAKITKAKAVIKEQEKAKETIVPYLLRALKDKKQRNVVTPTGATVEVSKGRASRKFTVTVLEFIDIVRDAGYSDVLDEMVTIGITAAEKYLGEAMVNKITTIEQNEWAGLKFGSLTKK